MWLKANLTINLAKSEFCKATVTYLGKVVGNGCVKPIGAKVEAICDFPIPTTRRELHRFLGMVGYYRSFCENFANVVSPLTDLLSPKITFQMLRYVSRPLKIVKLYLHVLLCWQPQILKSRLVLQSMLVLVVPAQYSCKKLWMGFNILLVIFQNSLTGINKFIRLLRKKPSP